MTFTFNETLLATFPCSPETHDSAPLPLTATFLWKASFSQGVWNQRKVELPVNCHCRSLLQFRASAANICCCKVHDCSFKSVFQMQTFCLYNPQWLTWLKTPINSIPFTATILPLRLEKREKISICKIDFAAKKVSPDIATINNYSKLQKSGLEVLTPQVTFVAAMPAANLSLQRREAALSLLPLSHLPPTVIVAAF